MIKIAFRIVATIAFGLPAACFGLGFRIADQDAAATARGDAFAATADNPSAIYYNPAGITQLQGLNGRVGVYGIVSQVDYEPPAGSEFTNRHQLQVVPQSFWVYTPSKWPV